MNTLGYSFSSIGQMLRKSFRKFETTGAWRSVPKWMGLLWTLWILTLFGSYFYHMLTLPDRWAKIQNFLQEVLP